MMTAATPRAVLSCMHGDRGNSSCSALAFCIQMCNAPGTRANELNLPNVKEVFHNSGYKNDMEF